MKKRILSILLAVCLVLTMFPMTALSLGEDGAASTEQPTVQYTVLNGSGGFSGEGHANLFDGDVTTKWCVTMRGTLFVIFKTDSPVFVSGFDITTANDNANETGRNPKNWTLYACNDYLAGGLQPEEGTTASNDEETTASYGEDPSFIDGGNTGAVDDSSATWVPIYSVTNDTVLQDENYTTYGYIFEKEITAYQYFKLEITANQGANVMQMSEFKLTFCDHVWEETGVPATCTEDGYTDKTCTVCNNSIRTTVPKLGHSYPDGSNICARCGQELSYTFDIGQGRIIITSDENNPGKIKIKFGSQIMENIDPAKVLTVTGSTTENELNINTDIPVTIKAKNLTIDRTGDDFTYALSVGGVDNRGQVTLILEGTNLLVAGAEKAGVCVGVGRTLIIEGDGTLEAVGGNGGAGIGSELLDNCGTIIINSGTVTATGNDGGSGIGGGRNYGGTTGGGGTVIINGGTVTANGQKLGSDIGGGQDNTTTGICIILGGTVTATNGSFGTNAGIKVNEDGTLEVYGDLTLPADITIPEGKTLIIPEGITLTVPEGITLTNNGTIINNNGFTNNGTVINNGTFINNGNLVETNHNYTNGFCICGEYEIAEEKDGVYQIKNAGNLCWFANYVNSGHNTVNAVLTNDIDFGGRNFIAIGTSSNPYQGTFDGCGYKITVNQSGSSDVAVFGIVQACTIKNLTVTGTIETAVKYAAGIAMEVKSSSGAATTVENCVSDVTINSTLEGDGTHGGLVGIANGNININNCAFTGAINGSATYNCAGVVGWSQSTTTVNNSYVSATFGVGTAGGDIISRKTTGNVKVTNFYYLNPLNTVSASGVTRATEAQFASGEIAYRLNSGVTDGTQSWYQTIGSDSTPIPNNTHGAVYYGYSGCNLLYANVPLADTMQHNFVNGFCSICGKYEAAELKDGVYQIKNAGNLFWFAALVNGDSTHADFDAQNTSASAVLTEDIDLENREWKPIMDFAGSFDGQGHTVSNFKITSTTNYSGFFGSAYGTVMNFTLKGEITLSAAGERIGSIVGNANGATVRNVASYVNISNTAVVLKHVGGIVGSIQTEETVVDKCIYYGNLNVQNSTDCIGGVVGYTSDGGRISNCANFGTVNASKSGAYVGGILGYVNNTKAMVKNCYNYGSVSNGSNSTYCGAVIGWVRSYTAENLADNYYLDTSCNLGFGSESNSGATATAKTSVQFESGEVAYLLNNGVTDGTQSWYQTLGTDAYPVPDNTRGTVYLIAVYPGCVNNPGEPADAYANTPESVYGDHTYDNGFCTMCDGYEPAELIDGVYQIKNAGNLYWFAALVNGTLKDGTAQNASADAVLVNDIIVNTNIANEDGVFGGKSWTPIGEYPTRYTGIFDGQNHTVSGLYFNDSGVNNIGLFGTLGTNGKISNVGVVDSLFFGGARVGGICGAKYGTVENCYNTSNINGTDFVGGICGNNYGGDIRNCYNTGVVSGTGNYIGGICGILNKGTIEKCYNIGLLSGSEAFYIGNICGFVGNNGTISECYFDTDKCDKNAVGLSSGKVSNTESKTAEEFASGEITFVLNDNVTDGTQSWYQTLGTDAYPVLDNTHGTVYCNVTYSGCSVNPGEPVSSAYENTEKSYYADHTYENGFCTMGGEYKPAELIDGVYQIKNAGNLYWFAALVNGTLTDGTAQNLSAKAVLVNDITVNTGVLNADGTLASDTSGFRVWTPICNSLSKAYTGTFDGQNHTVSGLYFNDSGVNIIGLFGHLGSSGKISNVGVIDSYFCGYQYVGGVCGTKYGAVENCYSACTVSGTYAIGGVCGNNSGGILLNCYNTGAVIGTGNYIGGVCGSLSEGKIENCYSTGTVSGPSDSYVGGVCGFSLSTITNCYFDSSKCDKNAVGRNKGTVEKTEGKTAEQFASGEVAYLLNNSVSDGTQKWYQTIGTDGAPVLDNTHGTVYFNAKYLGCAGNPGEPETVEYSNTEKGIIYADHIYENGFCTVCGGYEAAELKDGVYQIKNAGNLYWFAALVNGTLTDGTAQNLSANAVLVNDITVNTGVLNADGTLASDTSGFKAWTPIVGNSYPNSYAGTFDGQNHTVSGLYFNDSSANKIGLFGHLGSSGKVSNVGVIDSYFCGHQFVGGVCGAKYGAMENCYSASTVSGTESVGGVCGNNFNGKLLNCYNTGAVIGTGWYIGGVCGIVNNGGTIQNCYSTGTVGGSSDSSVGGVCGMNNRSSTISNCYFDSSKCDKNAVGLHNNGTVEKTEGKTTTQFESGEVAYLLNNSVSDGTQKWYQTIGTDGAPVLDNTHGTVYYGYSDCNGSERIYTNDPLYDTTEHSVVNGFCTKCGEYEAAELIDGVYQIKNAGNLYWFAALVNGTLTDGTAQNLSANAVLVNDITVNTGVLNADGTLVSDTSGFKVWTPIMGNSYPDYYAGTFDGQNHTVSGLYFNDSSVLRIGLFGVLGTNGKVYNVGVVDSYFCGYQLVGGVCGAKYGAVENCYSASTVSGTDSVGGVCGNNFYGDMKNCYNTGAVIGTRYYIGGVCGILNEGKIENCYSTGTVSGSSEPSVGSVCGLSFDTITNCYFDSSKCDKNAVGRNKGTVEKTEGKTAEQFASGEVAYLLNRGVTNGTQKWYQTIGEDSLPTLNNTRGTVYGGYGYCGSSERIYINTPITETRPDHSYTDGVCDMCGAEKSIVIIEADLHAEGLILGANTASDCIAELNTSDMYVAIKNINGVALTDTDLVGTGATITYYNRTTNAEIKTVTVVLYGDVNGDGLVDSTDKDTVMMKTVGAAEIENAWFSIAADANRDGVVDAFDAALINLQSANSYPITQKAG